MCRLECSGCRLENPPRIGRYITREPYVACFSISRLFTIQSSGGDGTRDPAFDRVRHGPTVGCARSPPRSGYEVKYRVSRTGTRVFMQYHRKRNRPVEGTRPYVHSTRRRAAAVLVPSSSERVHWFEGRRPDGRTNLSNRRQNRRVSRPSRSRSRTRTVPLRTITCTGRELARAGRKGSTEAFIADARASSSMCLAPVHSYPLNSMVIRIAPKAYDTAPVRSYTLT